jgi:hypothetical protein
MGIGLPSVEDYLGTLPLGIDSHPEAQVKGSLLHSLRGHPGFDELGRHPDLPREARRLLTEPPTSTTWISEVHFSVLMAGFFDQVFREKGDLTAYETWVCEQNARLFRSAPHRILFALASPSRALAGVPARWGAFHRGSTLTLVRSDAKSAEVRLTYPRNLFAPS